MYYQTILQKFSCIIIYVYIKKSINIQHGFCNNLAIRC